MDISVIGASGGCGRDVVDKLVSDGVLGRRELLQLVGANPRSSRPAYLHGLRADLQDAYAENVPELDVTDDPNQIIGDVVVMAAGATFPTDAAQSGSLQDRHALAHTNIALFETYARAIAHNRRGHPPVVIVLSNPVELGVHIFSQHLPREHVLGMGAFSDSQRFRWEIASELGLARQRVHAAMGGEHGLGMVPLWSTVRIHGLSAVETRDTVARLRAGVTTQEYGPRLAAEHAGIMALMQDDPVGGPVKALERIAQLPPDLRVALKPFPVHYSQAKTVAATSSASVELVKALCEGRSVEVCAQFEHQGEGDIEGPVGNRLLLEGSVRRVVPMDDLTRDERDRLRESGRRSLEKIRAWTGGTNHG